MRPSGPVSTDIVLVGGGHAHVQVMTRLAMAARPGLRVTLVTPDFETPYSGMLPGHLAGTYDRDAIHIDLARLAFATGTRLIQARAIGVDRAARRVVLEGRPPVAYDLLSLDVGIVPDLADIAGADRHALPVKPIAGFLDRVEALLRRLPDADGPRRFLLVGGGAAGVELALGLRRRLLVEASGAGLAPAALTVELATSASLVPTLNDAVRRRVKAELAARGIRVHENVRVTAIAADGVTLEGGGRIAADAVIVSTRARAPGWLAGLGLETAPDGSLVIGASLQATRDPRIFAVGDCAVLGFDPREKAGVFAVRQGPILAQNLIRFASGRPLREWRPQKRYLVLLSTGDGQGIGARGGWLSVQGRWVWRWKDLIDRRFMRWFHRFGRMGPVRPDESGVIPADLRCGGCAAKIGPAALASALGRLPPAPPDALARAGLSGAGLDGAGHDDAAIIRRSDGTVELETIDLIRSFVADPYLFGGIAALHALSDIHAMGGLPVRALALAQLPPGLPEKTAEDLYQLLAGARVLLDREGVSMAGGHSAEAGDLALGFAVTGLADEAGLRRKGGLRPGDDLVLTKPLGTGVIYAAAMRGAATGRSIAAALASQGRSNREAAAILVGAGATALTDVTGFGLAGHLAEMLAGSGVHADIDWPAVPLLRGAAVLARIGFESSLAQANRDGLGSRLQPDLSREIAALVADPQTSGGLLAAVPADRSASAVAALREAGYREAAIIGRAHAADGASAGSLRIVT